MLVHCSAGVGRTGTFIVIDTIMNRAERLETDLDIRNLVKHIRCSRNYLVQTLIQYVARSFDVPLFPCLPLWRFGVWLLHVLRRID